MTTLFGDDNPGNPSCHHNPRTMRIIKQGPHMTTMWEETAIPDKQVRVNKWMGEWDRWMLQGGVRVWVAGWVVAVGRCYGMQVGECCGQVLKSRPV